MPGGGRDDLLFCESLHGGAPGPGAARYRDRAVGMSDGDVIGHRFAGLGPGRLLVLDADLPAYLLVRGL